MLCLNANQTAIGPPELAEQCLSHAGYDGKDIAKITGCFKGSKVRGVGAAARGVGVGDAPCVCRVPCSLCVLYLGRCWRGWAGGQTCEIERDCMYVAAGQHVCMVAVWQHATNVVADGVGTGQQ